MRVIPLFEINGVEEFRSMEIRAGSFYRIPRDVLPIIPAADAVIDIGKECPAGKNVIVVSPECRERNYERQFPVGFTADEPNALPSQGCPTVNSGKVIRR